MSGAALGKGLIILDRDGVINHDSEHFIKSEDEWQPIPGSLEAIADKIDTAWKEYEQAVKELIASKSEVAA